MDWYFVEGGGRRGPVSETEINSLVASGKVAAETLVWNKTLKDWQRAGSTPLFGGAPPPMDVAKGTAVCIVTGKTFPTSHMLETEHGWVSAEARDTYFQALRERAPLPLLGGVLNVFADRKYVVVPVANAHFPRRCVKTNLPVTEDEVKRRKLYWCSPWVIFALLLNILVVLILYYFLRKKVELEIPLCAEGRRRLYKARAIAWGLFLLGCVLILASAFNAKLAALLLVGVVMLLASAVVGLRKGVLLRVAKLRDGKAWLTGASQEYLATLPKYAG